MPEEKETTQIQLRKVTVIELKQLAENVGETYDDTVTRLVSIAKNKEVKKLIEALKAKGKFSPL